ncbi:cystatin-type cysteine proteinase inhibitor CPI-2-like protein [Dinothrombium tinctorium]|nr:cystatin-type cysteine proteinase inhibitor CPI-2-like protein [Dinothrombium tinctorium]RWS03275.1 cystatin-type cysteine proteinase inhibitor CPI-2-like protein [Dinothrombium tinctorium]
MSAVGGWSDLTDESKKSELLAYVTNDFNMRSNSLYHSKAIRVLEARKQVVAGFKYRLKLEMAATECKKNVAHPNLESCELLNQPTQTVTFEVWEKPGGQSREITKFEVHLSSDNQTQSN